MATWFDAYVLCVCLEVVFVVFRYADSVETYSSFVSVINHFGKSGGFGNLSDRLRQTGEGRPSVCASRMRQW